MVDNRDIVVLIADDEPSMLALVSAFLKSKGYKVIEASDGEKAWQLAHQHLPDLVILDVMMPAMSGWEVCRKIREALPLAHTGVIMLTGIGENLNEMTSPLYGADAHIDKPFEFADLEAKMREVLAARRSEHTMGRADDADVETDVERESADEEETPSDRRAPRSSDTADDDDTIPQTRRFDSPEPAPARLAKTRPKKSAKGAAKEPAAKETGAKEPAAKKPAAKAASQGPGAKKPAPMPEAKEAAVKPVAKQVAAKKPGIAKKKAASKSKVVKQKSKPAKAAPKPQKKAAKKTTKKASKKAAKKVAKKSTPKASPKKAAKKGAAAKSKGRKRGR